MGRGHRQPHTGLRSDRRYFVLNIGLGEVHMGTVQSETARAPQRHCGGQQAICRDPSPRRVELSGQTLCEEDFAGRAAAPRSSHSDEMGAEHGSGHLRPDGRRILTVAQLSLCEDGPVPTGDAHHPFSCSVAARWQVDFGNVREYRRPEPAAHTLNGLSGGNPRLRSPSDCAHALGVWTSHTQDLGQVK